MRAGMTNRLTDKKTLVDSNNKIQSVIYFS
jgi:hypothetical protein